ncbi:MAG: hypothetical protein LC737_05805 [Chloroflexi bacterium]|nr:hypothetical protein [Chloroflexota bacterium]
MNYIKRFLAFWYDFIVGDDWTVALGVVIAFALSALLVRGGIDAWWLMPLAVVGLLALSLWRATRRTH